MRAIRIARFVRLAQRHSIAVFISIQRQTQIWRGVQRVFDVEFVLELTSAIILDDRKVQVNTHRVVRVP